MTVKIGNVMMTQTIRVLFCMIVLTLFLSGCFVQSTQIAPQVAKTLSQADFEQAKKKWQAQNIKNYRIVIKFYESYAVGLETEREVIIKQGKILSSSCIANECPAFVLRDVFTVENLFNYVWVGECLQDVTYDFKYGYPTLISVDCPEQFDEDYSIQVTEFEILK